MQQGKWEFYSGDELLRGEGDLYRLTMGEDENPALLENIMKQVQKYGEPCCIRFRPGLYWNGGQRRAGNCYAVFRRNNWNRERCERERWRKVPRSKLRSSTNTILLDK